MPVADDQTPVEGVIYQATYRVQSGVPVVHIFGRLRNGQSFLIRDRRERPHFYADKKHGAVVQAVADRHGATVKPSTLRGMSGEDLLDVEVAIPSHAPVVRDALHGASVGTYEADVRFAMRYLIDRNIRSGVRILGTGYAGRGTDWVFDEPELYPADVIITPRVLSFDIETNPRSDRLLAISMYGLGADEVVIVDGSGREMPAGALAVPTEAEALSYFCERVQALDVDVLTGWNVIDFDLSFLEQVAERVQRPLQLGRERGRMRIRRAEGYFGSGSASIAGRLVLDGMDLVRGAFIRMDDFSLEGVSRAVLGEGKAVSGDVHDRVGEILHNYREDLPAFAEYARTDARLPMQIIERLDLIALAFARSRLTGMTPDRVAASIASFDFLYLAELGRRRIAAPTVRSDDARVHQAQAGGQVFEPVAGLHERVWVLDFKSLYPSIIRTYGIDPLNYLAPDQAVDDAEVVVLDNGSRFKRDRTAILPAMLDRLFPQREEAKARGDGVASQAIKILMNSFYGVLGTPACRFYNPAIANAITSQGRSLLTWTKRWFEQRGFEVLYGDTDSVFVSSGTATIDDAMQAIEQLAPQINADLQAAISAQAGVESRLELEFEKLYEKLFFGQVRGGGVGASKRYVGQEPGKELEFVGMEVVRRDWTELAKTVQRELYARLFKGQAVEDYLVGIVESLRQGQLDNLLEYRKGLRKSVDDYTTSTPPHVVAARRSKQPNARIVRYVMTLNGPEPIDALHSPPDLEHYLDKQIRPVAEPVLATLGLEFARVIGDDRQLGLF